MDQNDEIKAILTGFQRTISVILAIVALLLIVMILPFNQYSQEPQDANLLSRNTSNIKKLKRSPSTETGSQAINQCQNVTVEGRYTGLGYGPTKAEAIKEAFENAAREAERVCAYAYQGECSKQGPNCVPAGNGQLVQGPMNLVGTYCWQPRGETLSGIKDINDWECWASVSFPCLQKCEIQSGPAGKGSK